MLAGKRRTDRLCGPQRRNDGPAVGKLQSTKAEEVRIIGCYSVRNGPLLLPQLRDLLRQRGRGATLPKILEE